MEYFNKKLDEILKKGYDNMNVTDYNSICISVRDTFNSYKELVENFFTDKAEEIHFIYQSIIKKNLFPYNLIQVCDCNNAWHNYMEYLEGFQSYIDMLMDLKITDEVNHEKLQESLNSIKERDSNFIVNLFNSDKNPKESTNINDAMKNIEVLIDIYNSMDNICHFFSNYLGKINESDQEYRFEIITGIIQLARSVIYFHYTIICEILKCYYNIHNSIQKRTPVGGEKTVSNYQLF